MRALIATLMLATLATADSARATLTIRKTDRVAAFKVPAAETKLTVRLKKSATATLEIRREPDGYARLRLEDVPDGASVETAAGPWIDLSPGEANLSYPDLIEAGDTAVQVPVPASDAGTPGAIDLTLECPEASIRQIVEGADVTIVDETGAARAVFLFHAATDQAGRVDASVTSPSGTHAWTANVYAWRWRATQRTVKRGGQATFRLDVEGLPAGATATTVLRAPEGLTLVSGPGAIAPGGDGSWTCTGGAGDYVFEASQDGDHAVTADYTPCAR